MSYSSAQDIAASSMSCLREPGMVLLGVFGCCSLPGVDGCVRKLWMDGWRYWGGERVYKERWMRVGFFPDRKSSVKSFDCFEHHGKKWSRHNPISNTLFSLVTLWHHVLTQLMPLSSFARPSSPKFTHILTPFGIPAQHSAATPALRGWSTAESQYSLLGRGKGGQKIFYS